MRCGTGTEPVLIRLINSLDQSIELFCVVKLINNSIFEHHYLVEQSTIECIQSLIPDDPSLLLR